MHIVWVSVIFHDPLWIVPKIVWTKSADVQLLDDSLNHRHIAMFWPNFGVFIPKNWSWQYWTLGIYCTNISIEIGRIPNWIEIFVGYLEIDGTAWWKLSILDIAFRCMLHVPIGSIWWDVAPGRKIQAGEMGIRVNRSSLAQGCRSLRVWLPCEFWAQGVTQIGQFGIAMIPGIYWLWSCISF